MKRTPADLAAEGRCAFLLRRGDPRACQETECRLHNHELPERGIVSARRLRRRQELREACAADLERVAPHAGVELTQHQVGAVLGESRQAVAYTEEVALSKVRAALRAQGVDVRSVEDVRRELARRRDRR